MKIINLEIKYNKSELISLLEKVIEAYLKYDVDTKVKVTNYANAQINSRLSNLLEQMEKSEKKLLEYKKENNLIDIFENNYWNYLKILNPVGKTKEVEALKAAKTHFLDMKNTE